MKVDEGESQLKFKIRQKCKKHNSDIGGICSELSCQDENQMKCVMCVSDEQYCIRKKGHQFIPVDEFVHKIFDDYYHGLKTSYSTSENVNKAENYCFNSNYFIDRIEVEKKKVLDTINTLCENITQHLERVKEDFKTYITQVLDQRESEIRENFLNLTSVMHYEDLDHYDLKKIDHHLGKMPYDCINSTLQKMKNLITNIQSNHHLEYVKKLDGLVTINSDSLINFISEGFNKLNNNMDTIFSSIRKEVDTNLFKVPQKKEIRLNKMKTIYNQHIDFSANSNFKDKKFVIYKSIVNNNIYLVYPTSLNNIKIEDFTQNMMKDEEIREYTSNENLHTNFSPNSRDRYLYFKLKGHLGRINGLIYFNYESEEKEFLITHSNDLQIKIWNLTNIHKYLNDPKGLGENYDNYINEGNVRTISGHKTPILDLSLYYEDKNKRAFIISISRDEKIFVWDMLRGECLFDLYDRVSEYKGTFEEMGRCFKIYNKNYFISVNNTLHNVKLWDFDSKTVLYSMNYFNPKAKIVEIVYLPEKSSVVLVDNKGTCGLLRILETERPIMLDMGIDNNKTERVGSFLLEDSTILFYCANGGIYLFDVDLVKFVERIRLGEEKITHCFQFEDKENNRKVICSHIINQKLNILG